MKFPKYNIMKLRVLVVKTILALDLDQTAMIINMVHATIKKPSSYHKIKIVCTTGRPNTVIKNILS